MFFPRFFAVVIISRIFRENGIRDKKRIFRDEMLYSRRKKQNQRKNRRPEAPVCRLLFIIEANYFIINQNISRSYGAYTVVAWSESDALLVTNT